MFWVNRRLQEFILRFSQHQGLGTASPFNLSTEQLSPLRGAEIQGAGRTEHAYFALIPPPPALRWSRWLRPSRPRRSASWRASPRATPEVGRGLGLCPASEPEPEVLPGGVAPSYSVGRRTPGSARAKSPGC